MKRIWTPRPSSYPSESTWGDNGDKIAKRNEKKAYMKRQKTANYHHRIKTNNEVLNVKGEMEMLTGARERYSSLYFEY